MHNAQGQLGFQPKITTKAKKGKKEKKKNLMREFAADELIRR